MYIITLNILFVDEERKIVLTESPYLFVNKELRNIITEIRRMVKEDFPQLANEMDVPITTLSMGMTTFSNERIHFFEVDYNNIKING